MLSLDEQREMPAMHQAYCAVQRPLQCSNTTGAVRMKILVACEFSGTVRDAFREQGHDAVSCDLLPTESPGAHYQGDVLDIINDDWDMMIAHPPCTYLCNSGVSWLYRTDGRWKKMVEGARFFKTLLEADIPKICVENPIMHGFARDIIEQEQTQVIQPWMFGIPESKATCLWLKNLRPLICTQIMTVREQRLHRLPPSPDRWKLRSKTYPGIARAMAEQWSLEE